MTDRPIRLLYFAWLRERVGRSEESIPIPAEAATVGALVAWLRDRGEPWETALAPGGRIRCAVNQSFAESDAPIAAGDEVAFFPPVTGG